MQCTVHIPHVHVHAYNYCTFYLYVSGLKYFVVRRCVVLCLLSPSHSSFLLLSFPLFPCSFLLPFLSLSLQMLQVPAWLIMTGAAPLLSLCSQGVEERSNSLHPQRDRKRRRPVRPATSTLIKQNKENSGAAGFHLSPTCLSPAATETKRLWLRDSTYEVRREGQREGGRGGREGREGREGGGKGGREGREGGREGGKGGGGGREGRGGRELGREGGRGRRERGRDRERETGRERERQRLQHFSSCLLPLPQTSSGSDSEAPMRKHPSRSRSLHSRSKARTQLSSLLENACSPIASTPELSSLPAIPLPQRQLFCPLGGPSQEFLSMTPIIHSLYRCHQLQHKFQSPSPSKFPLSNFPLPADPHISLNLACAWG